MNAVLPLLLLAVSLAAVPAGLACEKHLDGHQNGSDTQSEVTGR